MGGLIHAAVAGFGGCGETPNGFGLAEWALAMAAPMWPGQVRACSIESNRSGESLRYFSVLNCDTLPNQVLDRTSVG